MDWFLQSNFLLYLSGLFNVPHSPINTSTFSTPKYFLSNILTHLYSNEHIKGQPFGIHRHADWRMEQQGIEQPSDL